MLISHIYILIINYYKLPGTNNTTANKLDICNHSLGININNKITKVKIDITIDKELDILKLFNSIELVILLFLTTNAGIIKSWNFFLNVYECSLKNIVFTTNK